MKNIYAAVRALCNRKGGRFAEGPDAPPGLEKLQSAVHSFERANRGFQNAIEQAAVDSLTSHYQINNPENRIRASYFSSSLSHLLRELSRTAVSRWPSDPLFHAFVDTPDDMGVLEAYMPTIVEGAVRGSFESQVVSLASLRIQFSKGVWQYTARFEHRTHRQLAATVTNTVEGGAGTTLREAAVSIRKLQNELKDYFSAAERWPEFSTAKVDSLVLTNARKKLNIFLEGLSIEERACLGKQIPALAR